MNTALQTIEHRPWPLPSGPWIMAQRWHDLLFAHWPIPADAMRALVPPSLEVDTFDGEAWVGLVPFRMTSVRPRGLPGVPWLSAFPELNVRTYVRAKTGDPKPGVFFFSLDAANPVAVSLARNVFRLPYFNARMNLLASPHKLGGESTAYTSHRTHRHAPPAELIACYRPTGDALATSPGSVEQWLTERYCLYTVSDFQRNRGDLLRGDIHHAPWPLQPAEWSVQHETCVAAAGLDVPDVPPLLHFARRLDVVVWPLRKIKNGE